RRVKLLCSIARASGASPRAARRAAAPSRAGVSMRSQTGSRVTSRDMRWLEWIARWRFVTAPGIVREVVARGESALPTSVDRRMRALHQLGLVACERVLAEEPRLYWIRRAGMQLVGLSGAVVSPKFNDIRHDLRVLDV